MKQRLKIGDRIKGDVIGFGYYEVVSIDNFHINFKCLKIFGKGFRDRGHVTNIHHGTFPGSKKRIPINHYVWYCQKIPKKKRVDELTILYRELQERDKILEERQKHITYSLDQRISECRLVTIRVQELLLARL